MSETSKRALVIGIDRYAPQMNPLEGCVNDATTVRDVLRDRFRFPDDQIRFLTDQAATRKGILDGFEELIAKTQPGDTVVIYYAGHGSRLRDMDGDESEGLDSTVVPVDAIRWSRNSDVAEDSEILDITDDEIQIKLLRLSERTDNITMIFDCCHSGTISRGPSEARARALPGDQRPVESIRRPALSAEDLAYKARLADARRSGAGWWAPEDKYVLISGCRDSEQSYETDDLPRHGRLTFSLVQALHKAQPGTTYRVLFEQVAQKVIAQGQATGKPQHPQIEGAADRLLFQTEEMERLSYIRVSAVDGGTLTLAGGAAYGLTVGSKWVVIPAGGTREDAEAPLATITIVSVGALESKAQLDTEERRVGSTEDLAGAWAIEVAHDYGALRMKVRLVGDPSVAPEAWSELEKQMEEREGIMDRVDDGVDCVKVVLIPRGEVSPHAPTLLPREETRFAVVSETGMLMMPPKPADSSGIAMLLNNLKLWADYRYKLALENPASRLGSQIKVEVVRYDGAEASKLSASGGDALPAIQEGDIVDILLHNRGTNTVYVHAFDFMMNGAVGELRKGFPLPPTEPDQPYSLSGGEKYEMAWDEGFPFNPNPYVEPRTEGMEVYKFFLTTEEADLGGLAQMGGSRGGGGTPDPFAALLSTAQGTRGTVRRAPKDWDTVSFPLLLRQRRDVDVDAAGGEVGGLHVSSAEGAHIQIGGTVQVGGIDQEPDWRPDTPAARMRDLMQEMGLRPVESLTVGEGAQGRGAGALSLRSSAAEDGWGEVLMSTDDAGIVRWHLPEETSGQGRGAGARRVYRINPPPVLERPRNGSRGPIGAIAGKFIVDRLAFPWLEDRMGEALGALESRIHGNRVRLLDPAAIGAEEARTMDGESWNRLGEGKALLFLHGTFSRSDKAFKDLPPDFLGGMRERYGDRVFALDHPTVSQTPVDNVKWFMDQIPDGTQLDLDIISHSRGGLLARTLVEHGADFADRGQRLRYDRVVMVGSPHAGTALADPNNFGTLLDVFTNLLALWDPTEIAGVIVKYVQRLAGGVVDDLTGLGSMRPGSEFLASLASAPPEGVEYYGVGSDISSRRDGGMLDGLLNRLVSGVIPAANDLVVPHESILATGVEFAEVMTLEGSLATSHVEYFQSEVVRKKMTEWLLREGAPVSVAPVVDIDTRRLEAEMAISEPAPEPSERPGAGGVLDAPAAGGLSLPDPPTLRRERLRGSSGLDRN